MGSISIWHIIITLILIIVFFKFFRKNNKTEIENSSSGNQEKINKTKTANKEELKTLKFKNIEEILVQEEGWLKDQLGPSGQTYRIDLDYQNRPCLCVHDIIDNVENKDKQTPISNLFKIGRFMKLRKEGINTQNVSGYDEMDRISWKSNISERLTSGETLDNILENELQISKILDNGYSFEAVDLKTREVFQFSNMILTLPMFVELSVIK